MAIIIYITIIFAFILLINIIVCVKGYSYFRRAEKITVEKNFEIENQKQKRERIEKDIEELSNKRAKLLLAIEKEKTKEKEIYENEKNNLLEKFQLYKQNMNNAKEQYFLALEEDYSKAENEHDILIQQYKNELESAEARLKELQSSLNAAVQAQLREREKEENLQFYKLSVSPIDLEDIAKLNTLKAVLHKPVVLSKLIWSTYFQKQTTELCNRVFGEKTICGIYKITNIKTKQCYIGQSVGIQERIRQHIKCGLGIDASATNKLYNAMQNEGAWSFTFELLEECSREELNKKEAYWIQMYQSDKFGYNSTKGNLK